MENYFISLPVWLLRLSNQTLRKTSLSLRLFVILFLVSASFMRASNLYAQEVSLNLNVRNQTIESVLKEIEKQTEFTFFYNTSQIDLNKKVSIQVSREKIFDVLHELFKGTDIGYSVLDKSIVLSNKKNASINDIGANKQAKPAKKISGTIKDVNNDPLIGASIAIKGTTTGTFSDVDGRFSIEASEGQILTITLLGFSPQEVVVGSGNAVAIIMKEDNVILDDVVVRALGIKRSEKALSYNAQQISSDDVNTVRDANLMNSLVGKVAGVNINSSSTGIGGATKVVIRGAKSIEGDNNVLYVIDGIPMNNNSKGSIAEDAGIYSLQPVGSEGISDINPDDIESMTVLTGPAAAALYGSSAANGAIVITTKKGEAGRAKVVVANQTTFMNPFVMPKFQNTYGNEKNTYSSWGEKLATPSSYDPNDFFNTGSNVQNSISLSVGSEKNQTYVSAATTNAEGIIPNNSYDRYNFTFRNTTYLLNDKMTLDFSGNYIMQKNKNMIAQGVYFNPLVAAYTYPRGEDFDNVRLYEEYNDGRGINTQRWQWGDEGLTLQNPYWTANRNIFTNDKKRYMFNASLKYDIADWINVAGRVKIDNSNSKEIKKLYASTMTLLAGTNGSYARSMIEER